MSTARTAWIRGTDGLLQATLAVSGAVLAARAIWGPFQLGLAVRSPLTAESFFGISALLLVLLRARDLRAPSSALPPPTLSFPYVIASILWIGIAAWAWSVSFPFVADDYVHVARSLQTTPAYWRSYFTVPGADRFFRPFGYLAYVVEARAFATDRFAWHALSLGLHAVNSAMVFLIARTRRYGSWPAAAAALYFLLHGSHPEAVAWVAGQFDLWAAFFFFLALLAFQRSTAAGNWHWTAASCAALTCALLSKESAYVFPLILILLLWADRAPAREWLGRLAPPCMVTAFVFLYRWFLLGGIGGYRTGGTPNIYSINPYSAAKALFVRPAAILSFPVNWTVRPEWWLSATLLSALIATIVALGANASVANVDRRKLWFGLAFFWAAALPVHELLLIGDDLEKARVLYLPSAGVALAFAALLEALRPRVAVLAACVLLTFQTAALEHNLSIWQRVAQLADRTCRVAAQEAAASPDGISFGGLPSTLDGVYFLGNGFRQCVEMAAKRELPQMRVDEEGRPSKSEPPKLEPGRRFHWDGRNRMFVEEPVGITNRP
ncbi:MAG TPA: hypothetical protein VGR73_05700 [Bryobacteraceae bacterium]|nr:hypothetical protein [Bryobacteraceae bacterium]